MLWTPNNIVQKSYKEWLGDLPRSVKEQVLICGANGWRFFLVDQTRGRCYYEPKVITIPLWVLRHPTNYKAWYVCHEIAHTYVRDESHGPKFMAKLIEICPPESVIHEIGYKPRNAVAAGIGQTAYQMAKRRVDVMIQNLKDGKDIL